MSEQKQLKWISGFWRRIGAFSVDIIILGVVGLVLGLLFEQIFVEMGGWGRLVGFVVTLLYFGVMNSEVASGQTIGKKLLNIRVVDDGNKSIGIVRSFVRYSVLGIPFFLNNAHISDEIMFSSWIYVLSFVIFGGGFSIIYLYIFNRNTRQSLHDLIVGTFVVNVGVQKQNIDKVWRPHIIVTAILFLAAAVVPMYTMDLAQQEPFANLMSGRSAIMKNPQVMYANAAVNKSLTSDSKLQYLSAVVYLNEEQTKNNELAKKLATELTEAYGGIQENDFVVIKLVYGYDIGISSSWNSFVYRFKPNEIQSSNQ